MHTEYANIVIGALPVSPTILVIAALLVAVIIFVGAILLFRSSGVQKSSQQNYPQLPTPLYSPTPPSYPTSQYIPLPQHQGTTPSIFISHSHSDNDFGFILARDLRLVLRSENAVWYDAAGSLKGGDAWWHRIVTELTARNVFIVVLSPAAMASSWVHDEIDLAWKQKNSPAGKLIIPVVCRPCQIREDLATRQVISFVPPKKYEVAFNELLHALGI